MNYGPKRAVRFRHMLTFAALALQYVNLAHATAPDISFTPASLDFNDQAGAALPAAQRKGYFCFSAIFFSSAFIRRVSTSGGIGYGSMPL
jgi:hypothetical protein